MRKGFNFHVWQRRLRVIKVLALEFIPPAKKHKLGKLELDNYQQGETCHSLVTAITATKH
jgi:hypothetical protein